MQVGNICYLLDVDLVGIGVNGSVLVQKFCGTAGWTGLSTVVICKAVPWSCHS